MTFVLITTANNCVFRGKVKKGKVTLEQAMKAQKGSRGIALLFL